MQKGKTGGIVETWQFLWEFTTQLKISNPYADSDK